MRTLPRSPRGLRRALEPSAATTVAVLAAMTKLTAATCVVPFVLAVASGGKAGAGRRLLATGAGAALAAAVLLPIIGVPGFRDQVLAFHIALAGLPEVTALDKGAVVGGFLPVQWPLAAADNDDVVHLRQCPPWHAARPTASDFVRWRWPTTEVEGIGGYVPSALDTRDVRPCNCPGMPTQARRSA